MRIHKPMAHPVPTELIKMNSENDRRLTKRLLEIQEYEVLDWLLTLNQGVR